MSKVNIGKMKCETRGCDNTVTIKQNENGTLSYRCDECDAAPYARVGTGQHMLWMDQIVPIAKNDVTQGAKSDLNSAADTKTQAKDDKKTEKSVGIWGELP